MRTSQSQVTRYESCPRLWAWGPIGRKYEPQKKSGQRGEELHDLNQGYVKYGIDFPDTELGRVARKGSVHLPTRADMPLIEQESIVKYGQHEYTVKPDLFWLAPVGPVVMDYKTVEHFGYAMTPAKLRMELQPAVYAYHAMKTFETDEAHVVWLYYQCVEPYEVRPVEATIDMDMAQRILRAKQPIIDTMERLKREVRNPLQVVTNEAHCSRYRGCWYRPHCFPDRYEHYMDEHGKEATREKLPDVEYTRGARVRV